MRFLLAILFSFIGTLSYGQYDTILHKTFIQKRQFLSDFYRKTLKIHDLTFTGKQEIIEGMRKFGEQHHDESLVTEAALAKAWLQSLESQPKKMQTALMQEFISSALEKKDYVSAARAYRTLAELYWRIDENYELAFEYHFKNLEIGKLLTEDLYPEKMIDCASIGAAFYTF